MVVKERDPLGDWNVYFVIENYFENCTEFTKLVYIKTVFWVIIAAGLDVSWW